MAIEQADNSIMLDEFSVEENQKYAVVFGNEVKGVQQEVVTASDNCIEIPQLGTKLFKYFCELWCCFMGFVYQVKVILNFWSEFWY